VGAGAGEEASTPTEQRRASTRIGRGRGEKSRIVWPPLANNGSHSPPVGLHAAIARSSRVLPPQTGEERDEKRDETRDETRVERRLVVFSAMRGHRKTPVW
jgi:hypothetical protein